MRYYNYLTTPSAKKCNLYEISNKEYLVLLKFLNGDNYEGFFKALNSLICKTIPDFLEFDIIDKAYVYIAFYFYSIRGTIGIKSDKVDSIEVPLTVVLDSIENAYINKEEKIKFYKWDECIIGYPTILDFEGKTININFASGIKSINGVLLTPENKIAISKNATLQDLNRLENIIRKNFDNDIFFVKDYFGVSDIKDSLLNPGLFYSIAYIFKESLEQFYNMMYLMCHYVRISWENLMEMTPLELSIVYKDFAQDKEEQSKHHSKHKGSINLNDPNISDTLMGY